MTFLIGSQVPDDPSVLKALQSVYKMKAGVAQVFLRDMCTTSKKGKKELDEKEKKAIAKFVTKKKLPVYVHASYLLNFCKVPAGKTRIHWAYQILHEDMKLAQEMKFKGVVLHMCSRRAVDEKWKPYLMTREETIQKMINHLRYFFKNYSDYEKVTLLLENSASEGNKIGGPLKDLYQVYDAFAKERNIGVCIDTCHAFAAGYPINTVRGMKGMIAEFKELFGSFKAWQLIHLNDSKLPLDSHKDRHAPIGEGYIFKSAEGKKALAELISFASRESIPMILETHGDYKKEIRLVRSLLSQKGGRKVKKEKILELIKEFQTIHKALGNKREADQYGRAYQSLKGAKIKQISSGKELMSLPWIGRGIAGKVDEYLLTGKVKLLEEFRKNPKVKATRELAQIFGVGPKMAQKLVQKGINSVAELKKESSEGKVKLTKSQLMGLKYYSALLKRIPRKESEAVQKEFQKGLEHLFKKKYGTIDVFLAGSYRMGKADSGDIDLIVTFSKLKTHTDIHQHPLLEQIVTYFKDKNKIIDTLVGSDPPHPQQTSYIGVWQQEEKSTPRHIDIHVVGANELPHHMLYFGSGERFSRMIRQWAKEHGYKLTDKALVQLGKKSKMIPVKNEREIFSHLGLPWVPPKERNVVNIKELGTQ